MSPDDVERATTDPVISIGLLAQRVGLSVSAVRKYENEGLVLAHRTEGGRRLFCHEDIARVTHIQHLIQDLGLNIEGIRRLQALLPCWKLLPCSAEMRAHCPAYGERSRPCWAIKGLDCACQGNACRECVVYRSGSLCTDQVKPLVHAQDDLEDTGPLLRELIDRERQMSTAER